jgi:actin-like ATPase involved in cell morphogenesis
VQVLGVDFGAAFIRAASFSGATRLPELVLFPDGSRALPAVVSLDGDRARVGRGAVSRAATHPATTVRGIKRLLGRKPEDPIARAALSGAGFSTTSAPDGTTLLELAGRSVPTEQIAAALLSTAAEAARALNDEPIELAVIAVPHWFGPSQRQAMMRAAERAGLRLAQLSSEPTATALSLKEHEPEPRRIGLVDVGAVACTASILEVCTSRVELIASVSELGGGDDVEASLVRALLRGLTARTGALEATPAVREVLRQVCDGLARDLAHTSQATAVIPFLPVGSGLMNQQVVVSREVFERVLGGVAARIERACSRALEAASTSRAGLTAVYATGGLMRLTLPRAAVERGFGPITQRRLDPDGAVAVGAALQAGMLCGLTESVPVIDVQASASRALPAVSPSLPPIVESSAPERQAPSPRSPTPNPETERSLRAELADLLAALRAGALTSDASAQGSRLLGLTDELIDVDDVCEPAAVAALTARLEAIWQKLGIAMQTIRQYGWQHPQTTRQLAAAFDQLERALVQDPRSIQFEVRPTGFSRHGKLVYRPDRAPFDAIPHELFAAGFRRVQLKPGLTLEELTEFLGVLLRDAARGFGADDDFSTALFERRLPHVAYVAVDSFSDSDDPRFELERDRLSSELAANFSVGDDAALDAFFDAQRRIGELVGSLSLDAGLVSALSTEVDPAPGVWLERGVEQVVAACQAPLIADALVAAIASWSEAQLAARAEVRVCELSNLIARLAQGLDATVRSRLLEASLPRHALPGLLERLLEGEAMETSAVTALARSLDGLQSDLLLPTAAALPSNLPAEVRRALLAYLLRNAREHPEVVARALPRAAPEEASALLSQLLEAGAEAASAAVEQGLGSPHWSVRMACLREITAAPSPAARALIHDMLHDGDPANRIAVLGLIGERRLSSMGPTLVRRIEADAFHALSLLERGTLLEVVGALNPRRAEELAIALVSKKQVVPSDAVEHSRALAVDFLARVDSSESLALLEEIAKKRWGNSQLVREAAGRAVQRRSLRPPGGAE